MKANERAAAPALLAAAIMILATAACLASTSATKRTDKSSSAKNTATLMAAASPLEFGSLASVICTAGPECEEMALLEKQMVELINADRLNPVNESETGGRARPLKWDPRLAAAAMAHSVTMAKRNYFSHVDPDGESPVERFYKAGIQWRSMGENIARDSSVAQAESAFMNEPRFQPNHRGNILNPKFNYVGIGIMRGADGSLYVTQDFAQEE